MRRLTATMSSVEVQVALLIATVTVEIEQGLQLILGCVRMKSVRMRRERLELKYSVLQL